MSFVTPIATFQSIYRPDFHVLEERHGRTRLFPHTEQLPVLWRALNLEFLGPLPPKIARVDKRADGFHKILRQIAVCFFCDEVNSWRADGLTLFGLADYDLVFRVAVVQQITEETRRGIRHWFRFYAGPDFQPEIRLSGKRLVFTEHVLERFSSRAPHCIGEDLSSMLDCILRAPVLSMRVPPGRAFVFYYCDSILAFTYEEKPDEFVLTTCLTINELHSLEMEIPVETFTLHYSAQPEELRGCNWFAPEWMADFYRMWTMKVPFTKRSGPVRERWGRIAYLVKDVALANGHGPGSEMYFVDHIPGPAIFKFKPGKTPDKGDAITRLKAKIPDHDWEGQFPALRSDSPS